MAKTTVASAVDVVIATGAYSVPSSNPPSLLSAPDPSLADSNRVLARKGGQWTDDPPPSLVPDPFVLLPPPGGEHLSRRISAASVSPTSSSSKSSSKAPFPVVPMLGCETVGDDRFEAMEEEEIFAEALKSAEWIQEALKGRDEVSRVTIKEMSSDAVSKSLAYLRDKARFLSARADFIYEHNGRAPETVFTERLSSRDKMLRWMEIDPPRVPSGASSSGRLTDVWAGVHSGDPAPKPPDGNDGLGGSSLTAPKSGDKELPSGGEAGAGAGGAKSKDGAVAPRPSWRDSFLPARHPTSLRKPSGPSVQKDPIVSGVLTREFLEHCNAEQLQLLQPLVRKLSVAPEVEEETEQERQQALLAAYFPNLFTSTPRVAPVTRLRPSVSRALKFPTPKNSEKDVGGTDESPVAALSIPITDVLREEFSKLTTKMRSEMKVEVKAEVRSVSNKTESKADVSLEEEDNAFRMENVERTVGSSASAPECKVPIFKRGNRDLTIETWFYQMRAYFTMHNNDRRFWVMQCSRRIHSSHFKEISPFLKYNYENFRYECMKLFDVPDLTQTYLTELADLAQGRDEDYESFHDRVRDLVSKSHPELTGDAHKRLMSSYFTRGLVDDRVCDVVSATPGISSQEALRRASAMASSRRKGCARSPL